MLTRLGMDAKLWTKEFLETFRHTVATEQDLFAWFANMIMAGYDHGRRSVGDFDE